MKKIIALTLTALTAIAAFAKPFVPGKTAVVTIMANDTITWFGEDDEEHGSGLLNLAVRKDITENASKEEQIQAGYTAYMMEDVKAAVFEVLAEKGLDLIPEETVLASNAYTAASDNKILLAGFMNKPEGYKLLATNEKKLYPLLISELGADNIVLISFNIQKNMNTGVSHTGNMKACATVTIQFLDAKGKMAKSFSGYGSASEAIPVVKGVYDPQALAEQYPEALRAAVRKALEKL